MKAHYRNHRVFFLGSGAGVVCFSEGLHLNFMKELHFGFGELHHVHELLQSYMNRAETARHSMSMSVANLHQT